MVFPSLLRLRLTILDEWNPKNLSGRVSDSGQKVSVSVGDFWIHCISYGTVRLDYIEHDIMLPTRDDMTCLWYLRRV